MKCFSALTYSIYLDDELSREERQQVERHLASCALCARIVEELRAESVLLRRSLSELEPERSANFLFTRGALEFALVVLLVVSGGLLGSWLSNLEVPSALSWLDPTSSSGGLNLMFQTSFFLRDASSLWEEYMNLVSWGIVLLVIASVTTWIARSRLFPARNLILAVLVAMMALPAAAIDHRKGGTVVVPEGQTIDDTLVVHAQAARINGIINGDLIVFAQRVDIRGEVKGDVISWAQQTDVRGRVQGNVYSFSQSLGVSGEIQKNAYSWAQSARLDKGGRIKGTLVSGSAELVVDGDVERDLYVFSKTAELVGSVARHVRFRGEKLRILDGARVTGDVWAGVRRDSGFEVASGAQIGGKVDRSIITHKNRFARPSFYFWSLVLLAGGFLVGWLLLKFFPAFVSGTVAQLNAPSKTLGLGFAVLFSTPIAIIVVGITLIGIPLALMLLALYVIAIYLAHIFVAVFVGTRLLRKPDGSYSPAAALLLGLLVIAIVTAVPYVGGFFKLLVVCFGVGAFAWQFTTTIRRHQLNASGV